MNELTGSYFKYWGKAQNEADGSAIRYHLLPYHCLDVVAVAGVWLTHSTVLLRQAAQQVGQSEELTRRMILFFVALHDLGKYDARFQEFVPKLRCDLQGDDYEVDREAYDHGSYGYLHFQREYFSSPNMLAVAGHHGFCDKAAEYFEPDADEGLIQQDRRARQEWVSYCLAYFELNEIPDINLITSLAGLCSVSDWIGSSITNFTETVEDLNQYYIDAIPRAKQALTDAGLLTSIEGSGFNYLFPNYAPRGIQRLIPDIPVQAGLTIVESDTGSGKTEFALAYASLLIKEGLADGIVFGLPTQATANGLFDRIGEAATKLFPDSAVTLAHSKAKYLIPDENGFLHQSSKRAFLGSMSVATVDQVLMGVLGVKHQFVRSFGTQKSVLILDEIHSFDAYMYGLITKVISGQHESYSSVILLSATLPFSMKDMLLEVYGGESISDAYPLITQVDLNGRTRVFEVDEPVVEKIINNELWNSESLLPTKAQCKQLIKWAENGAVVGVICNTVHDAQLLYQMMSKQQSNVEIDLFHARFAVDDRIRIEKDILNKYGKDAPRKGRLLIATQVVEQSLDLDFDVIVSQIAPIELLMQRMGRLWRHDRTKDLYPRSEAIKAPIFITLCPPIEVVETNYSTTYKGSAYVYKNIRALYRTQRYLIDHQKLVFPYSYRAAITWVHSSDNYPAESEELSSLAEEFKNTQDGSYFAARQLCNQSNKPLTDVDPRCALLTREGETSQSVVLFNKKELLHGGDYTNQFDRERSMVSLSRKQAKGKIDSELYCLKAVIGEDVFYNNLGVYDERLERELQKTSEVQ